MEGGAEEREGRPRTSALPGPHGLRAALPLLWLFLEIDQGGYEVKLELCFFPDE